MFIIILKYNIHSYEYNDIRRNYTVMFVINDIYYFQLGVAVGFLLPPIFVKMSENKDDIGRDLETMFYSVAAFTTVLFITVLLCKYFLIFHL